MENKFLKKVDMRQKIIDAALCLFFENGYDATTVRMIQNKVGKEVGLFYYYFKNKDQVFEEAIAKFFTGYKSDLEKIVDRAYRDPFRILSYFFMYVGRETELFRENYASNLHWTVRFAIREKTMQIIEPYLKRIIEILIGYSATPKLDLDTTTRYLTYGACSTIIHEDKQFLDTERNQLRKGAVLLMGLSDDEAKINFPEYITEESKNLFLNTINISAKEYNLIKEEKIANDADKIIAKHKCFAVICDEKAVGVVIFSRERKSVDYLYVLKEYRNNGIATRLLITALSELPPNEKAQVVSLNSDDKLLKDFGFSKVGEEKEWEYFRGFSYTRTLPTHYWEHLYSEERITNFKEISDGKHN